MKNAKLKEKLISDIYNRYGGMMSATDVGKYLGLKHHASYEKWLMDVPAVIVNGRKKWMTFDVAEKIYKDTI